MKALPNDQEVEQWFSNNCDENISASSAIHKFRQWLVERNIDNLPEAWPMGDTGRRPLAERRAGTHPTLSTLTDEDWKQLTETSKTGEGSPYFTDEGKETELWLKCENDQWMRVSWIILQRDNVGWRLGLTETRQVREYPSRLMLEKVLRKKFVDMPQAGFDYHSRNNLEKPSETSVEKGIRLRAEANEFYKSLGDQPLYKEDNESPQTKP